jgi:23S rRNA (guanosine2251-2'-O)-methyltransferase
MDATEARRKVGDESHQGAIAVIDAGALVIPFGEFLDTLHIGKATSLALLGEVQDPHNVGAIIRSAAAFGLSGVLIPEHNQAQVTGTVVKTSAGMAFRIPLVSIGNVNDTIRTLKEKGFWIYGMAMDGNSLPEEKFDAPAVFILGNEGAGIREKTLEACDIKLAIPMHPRCESLNVAVSAGVVFNAWVAQHPHAMRG